MTEVVPVLREKFGSAITALQETKDDFPTIWITSESVITIMTFLKNEIDQPFKMLYDLTAIDEQARNNRQDQPTSKFTIVYQLLSFERNNYIRLKVALLSLDHQATSITPVWRSANWYEREVFDLFGVKFSGHPNIRRILMPDTWNGHPLQKCHPRKSDGDGTVSASGKQTGN